MTSDEILKVKHLDYDIMWTITFTPEEVIFGELGSE